MKKMLCCLMISLVFSGVLYAAGNKYQSPIRVIVDGLELSFYDQEPITVDGRTLVPVRDVFESLGWEVDWNEETATVLLSIFLEIAMDLNDETSSALQNRHYGVRSSVYIVIQIGAPYFYVKSTVHYFDVSEMGASDLLIPVRSTSISHSLDVPAKIVGGRIMLPIRKILESVGYVVEWDYETQSIKITTALHETTLVPRAQQTAATQVNSLNLSGQGIDCERLADMVYSGEIPADVTYLNLAVNDISDISPLSYLTNLTELNLWGNRVSDVSHIKNLTDLKVLNLWGNRFSDISMLGNLVNLERFSLGDNIYFNGDLSVLENFTNLTNLGLGDAYPGFMDFSYLEALVNLERLQIWGAGRLYDISIIANLINLTHLTLHASSVRDFTPLSNLNLTRLDLQSSRLTDLSVIPLESFPNISELVLFNNEIIDITIIGELTTLTTLVLRRNQISDVSPLKNLKNLRFLDLSDNFIPQEQFQELREALPRADIRG